MTISSRTAEKASPRAYEYTRQLQGTVSCRAELQQHFAAGTAEPYERFKQSRITLSPVSGLKRRLPRLKNYGDAVEPLLRLQTRPSHTYLTAQINRCSQTMRIMYTSAMNNTIYGTKYKKLPNTKGKNLVADVSSCFLSEPVDVSKYAVIYGGVQKNVGPAGTTHFSSSKTK